MYALKLSVLADEMLILMVAHAHGVWRGTYLTTTCSLPCLMLPHNERGDLHSTCVQTNPKQSNNKQKQQKRHDSMVFSWKLSQQ